MYCTKCGQQLEEGAPSCLRCGQSTYQGPPPIAQPVMVTSDDGLASLIPYRNGAALAAYYLGIFSFIPVLGLLLGVPAFILGIKGLRVAGRNPMAKGKVHAWVGIITGGLFSLLWLAMLVVMVVALIATQRQPR